MFTGINLQSNPVFQNKEETPVDHLLGCHQRIRHFIAVAKRIAGAKDVPLDELADAAADVHRYFTVAFPLHEADENSSIDPRLVAAVPGSDVAYASEQMLRQHREINAVLKSLMPLWDALCREPEKLSAFSPRLTELSSRFETLCDVHLKLEEEIIFPAIEKCLSPAARQEILREMRERRR